MVGRELFKKSEKDYEKLLEQQNHLGAYMC